MRRAALVVFQLLITAQAFSAIVTFQIDPQRSRLRLTQSRSSPNGTGIPIPNQSEFGSTSFQGVGADDAFYSGTVRADIDLVHKTFRLARGGTLVADQLQSWTPIGAQLIDPPPIFGGLFRPVAGPANYGWRTGDRFSLAPTNYAISQLELDLESLSQPMVGTTSFSFNSDATIHIDQGTFGTGGDPMFSIPLNFYNLAGGIASNSGANPASLVHLGLDRYELTLPIKVSIPLATNSVFGFGVFEGQIVGTAVVVPENSSLLLCLFPLIAIVFLRSLKSS